MQILPDYPVAADTSIWAIYPSSRLVALKVWAFIDHFAGCFDSPPYWDLRTDLS